MSRIAWFCIPAAGHTNPTIEVVRRLVQAGHAVRYYSFEMFREKIEGAGAQFVSCDACSMETKLGPEAGGRIAKDTAFATKVLVETTLALDETLLRGLREFEPDLIVADSMALWGKLLAKKIGVPFVSSTTTFAFNEHSSRVMKQSVGQMLRLILGMPKINREIERLKKRGYEIDGILDIVANDNDTDTIVYTSACFQPFSETFSKKYHFVGPSVRESEPIARISRRKRVYISLGTVNNDMPAFFRRCIEQLGGKYELILSVGDRVDPQQFGELPGHVTVSRHVDQMAVLADCDAFVTHCGMNSVSEALYFGVPMVLYPQTAEQRGVARRTAELGAGVFAERSIARAVETVLVDEKYRIAAQKIGKTLREAGGAEEAAKVIERLAQR